MIVHPHLGLGERRTGIDQRKYCLGIGDAVPNGCDGLRIVGVLAANYFGRRDLLPHCVICQSGSLQKLDLGRAVMVGSRLGAIEALRRRSPDVVTPV